MSVSSHFTSIGKAFAVVFGAGLLAVNGLGHAVAQPGPDAQTQPDRDAKVEVNLGSQQNQPEQNTQQLNSFIAVLLAVQSESAAELSQVVAEQAESSKIGQFAAQAADQLKSQSEQLRNFASIGESKRVSAVIPQGTDLSGAAQDIGQDIRERIQERRAESGNTAAAEQRAADARGIRRDRGEQNRPRVVLPAIRKNLPQIMELAGEAIEQGIQADAQPRSRIQLLVEIAEETLNAKEQELVKYQGEAYEQAYLGMLLDAGLEIEAAARASEPMAGGALKEALKDVQQTASELADQARRHMTQGTDIARRNEPRSERSESDNSSRHTIDGQKLP